MHDELQDLGELIAWWDDLAVWRFRWARTQHPQFLNQLSVVSVPADRRDADLMLRMAMPCLVCKTVSWFPYDLKEPLLGNMI
jgi:hypothetical protein